jgi:hypothetical protein
MHYVKKDKKIVDQIDDLCKHYKFSNDVFACMKEIAYNALIKGILQAKTGIKIPKNINNL